MTKNESQIRVRLVSFFRGTLVQHHMIKKIISLTRWLANSLNRIVTLLEGKGLSTNKQSKFVDLAPTDEADKAGIYSEAIIFATNNTKVFNIALTGPYGSGKSSIIQTFLKRYQRPALHISLAAFVPEADHGGDKVSRQEIERSILQQMLYGADANRLPLSRFKRIQSPGVLSILKSLYIMLGTLALWYVFHQREKVFSGDYFIPFELSNGMNFLFFAVAILFLWMTLHHFYVASFGLSLKSISLKDIELKPAHDDQTSILNRHLDEIVYFFQSTKYDLVIIEDLDRFNNADIFVTLREINSLVNENAGIKRTIRFLYALRDDMFVSTDRTKFFEFIIPVIPIINTSNSIDMVLRQGERLELDERLEPQFLREVSRYLNDLRLIQNIFNEYAIYVSNLETDGENVLNANKLLAILIYKNVYPRDFELLHRGVGILAEIFDKQGELIENAEAKHRAEISKLENNIDVFDRQITSDLKELRNIYAMTLIERLPVNAISVSYDQQTWIGLPQLANHSSFEQLIGASRLYNRQANYHYPEQVDLSKLQSEVDLQKCYQQRKNEIENNTADNRSKIFRQIRDLKSKIAVLRTTKLNELLRLNIESVQDVFNKLGENGELARFLILEGYIDDTYYQYTSLFHSGRLSPNDNKFLIKIRAFITPEPVFPIDNPNEVIAAMREEDFRQSYILNVQLIDSVLGERNRYLYQSQKFFELLSSKFEICEDFFDAYYTGGRHVVELISGLENSWKEFVPAAIASPNSVSHITRLLENISLNQIKKLSRDFYELSEFVSANLAEILVNLPELAPERIVCLNFEVKDLSAIKEHADIVHVMFEKGLFELTLENIEYIYQVILGEHDIESLHKMNFTAIRSTNNKILMQRIEREFEIYFKNILLKLERNSEEDVSSIITAISHDTLEQNDIRTFIEQQVNLLPILEDVPEQFHSMLFQICKIEPTWLNCLAFIKGKEFDPEILVEYLERDDVRKFLLEQPISSAPESLILRQFLFNAGSLSDSSYREYVHALPKPFQKTPEGFESNKLKILIEEGKITFTSENLDEFSDNRDLQILFIVSNIKTYLTTPAKFSLDDELHEAILRSQIDISDKLKVVELMDLGVLFDLPKRAAIIGPIIERSDANISSINSDIAQALIKHSRPITTQISLFNKYHSLMTNDEVRHVLAELPTPFSEIKIGYNSPRLKNSPENLSLVRWLGERNVISSWSGGRLFTDDIKVNLYRR